MISRLTKVMILGLILHLEWNFSRYPMDSFDREKLTYFEGLFFFRRDLSLIFVCYFNIYLFTRKI